MKSDITIVTTFYNFNNKKHHTVNYFYWINNYLPNIDNYMIIYCDKNSEDIIKNFRKNYLEKTKIYTIDIEDFYTYKYLDRWKNYDIHVDHEKNYHNTDLYMIWNEKENFLKLAINSNPFNTNYFVYTDIGMIREEYYIEHIKSFPDMEKINSIDKNKVYLLNVGDEVDYNFKTPNEYYRYRNCIGGGVILGHKDVLLKFIDYYYLMIDDFIKNNLFSGKDQNILANVCIKHKDIIELIKPKKSPLNNDWFYMIYHYSSV